MIKCKCCEESKLTDEEKAANFRGAMAFIKGYDFIEHNATNCTSIEDIPKLQIDVHNPH